MVKIGRSLATGSDDGSDKDLGGKGAKPPTSSTPIDSQEVKERITVVLVRNGFDLQSVTRRILVIAGDMTFTEFRSLVCETLGLSDSYPVRLTVVGARSNIRAGTRMATLFEEAMEDVDNDGVLYVRH